MKIHFTKHILAAAILSFAFAGALHAQTDPNAAYYEMSLEENIQTPKIPNKHHNAVKDLSDVVRHDIVRQGFDVKRMRDGEVVVISIPCEQLFAANATVLTDNGTELLRRLKHIGNHAHKYKMLIAVHSDDTGEEGYSDAITSERANAIDDLLLDEATFAHTMIIPYGIGRDEPLQPNDSAAGRAANRRVEIYLVPLQSIYSKK